MIHPNQSILVVDDTKQNRTLLKELLQPDHRIYLAKDGQQALTMAAKHRPGLILLDILLPDMSGYDVLVALKRTPATQNIPVIFITALNNPDDESRGLKLGAVDFISKPFSPPVVLARVKNQLTIARQKRMLEELAFLDSLTEIPNRRQFDQSFEREWKRTARSRSPLSLIMIDIDYFKAYNDHYGHAGGDAVLCQVAAALQQVLQRPADLLARIGGEEFIVLLPDTDESGGRRIAEQLLLAVHELHIPHQASGVTDIVTISLGGLTIHPISDEVDKRSLQAVDERLYQAKSSGRNRICWGVD